MCLGFYNIVSPANERVGPKDRMETHCIVRGMTDWVNYALFSTVLISACKQILEMTSLAAKALERMTFALPYSKSDITEKQISIHPHNCVKLPG
jgi:hypothetical protein